MTEHADAAQVQPVSEPSGQVRSLELLEPVEYEAHVGEAHVEGTVAGSPRLRDARELEPPAGELHDRGLVGVLEREDDEASARELFEESGVESPQRPEAGREEKHRMTARSDRFARDGRGTQPAQRAPNVGRAPREHTRHPEGQVTGRPTRSGSDTRYQTCTISWRRSRPSANGSRREGSTHQSGNVPTGRAPGRSRESERGRGAGASLRNAQPGQENRRGEDEQAASAADRNGPLTQPRQRSTAIAAM